MGFASPIIGGGGALQYPAIKSPNYVPGVSGWAIFKNGNAEFNGGTFRGTVSGAAFVGPDFLIDNAGIFLYSGAQAFVLANLQSVQMGGYVVEANEFGSGAAYQLTGNTGSPYGFTVSLSAINNVYPGSPGAYGHIFCGFHYGSTSPESPFPIQVQNILAGQVQTSLDVTLATTGISDCVYDNWFNVSSVPPGGVNSNTGLEMMIWLASVGGTGPPGSKVASGVLINGYLFDVWFHGTWANAAQGTVSYQHVTQQTSVTYDMRPFMDDMIGRGYLSKLWYLIAIEAGFELWNGGAGHRINSFTVSNAPLLPAGTLVTSIAPVGGTEPYGAPYVSGIVEGPPGAVQAALRTVGGNGEFVIIIPGFVNPAIVGGISGSFSFMELIGPISTVVGFRDKLTRTMFSSDGVGSSANEATFYTEDNGTNHSYMIVDRTGTSIPAGRITAAQPGVTPAVPEVPHTFAPLTAGYNITSGYADYMMTAEGRVHLSAHIGVTAGPGLAFVKITTNPLPPLYRPSVNRFFVIGANELAIFSGSNNAGAIGQLGTDGNIYVYGASTFATEIDFEVDVRL